MRAREKIIVRWVKARTAGKGSIDFSMAFILPGADEAAVNRSGAIRWYVTDKREADRVFRRVRLAAQEAADSTTSRHSSPR